MTLNDDFVNFNLTPCPNHHRWPWFEIDEADKAWVSSRVRSRVRQKVSRAERRASCERVTFQPVPLARPACEIHADFTLLELA